MRLQDPSEFVGIFVVVPRHATRAHVAHTFVKLGFQFVPHEAALPPGVPRANPEHEVRAHGVPGGCMQHTHPHVLSSVRALTTWPFWAACHAPVAQNSCTTCTL